MNGLQLKESLMKDARIDGICTEGYSMMRRLDTDGLIGYYLENPDWCIERGFPTIDILRREFSDIEDKGVFVGRTFDGGTFSRNQVYVFHDCKGHINVAMDYDNAVIPMLYFANGCAISVGCAQSNTSAIIVPLYISEDSAVTADDNENCKFRRNWIKPIKR